MIRWSMASWFLLALGKALFARLNRKDVCLFLGAC